MFHLLLAARWNLISSCRNWRELKVLFGMFKANTCSFGKYCSHRRIRLIFIPHPWSHMWGQLGRASLGKSWELLQSCLFLIADSLVHAKERDSGSVPDFTTNFLCEFEWVTPYLTFCTWSPTSLWVYHKIPRNINYTVLHKSTWLQKAKGHPFVSILLQNLRQYNLWPMKRVYANWAYIRHVYETAGEYHHLQSFKFCNYYWCYIYFFLFLSLSL